jgi:hypothetical protein
MTEAWQLGASKNDGIDKIKTIEHAAQKELMDLRIHIIPIVVAVQWNKISEKLQKLIKNRMPKNGKMYKDKWNGTNSNFKKLYDFHKITRHHTSYWKLTTNKRDKEHLLQSFNT